MYSNTQLAVCVFENGTAINGWMKKKKMLSHRLDIRFEMASPPLRFNSFFHNHILWKMLEILENVTVIRDMQLLSASLRAHSHTHTKNYLDIKNITICCPKFIDDSISVAFEFNAAFIRIWLLFFSRFVPFMCCCFQYSLNKRTFCRWRSRGPFTYVYIFFFIANNKTNAPYVYRWYSILIYWACRHGWR